MTAKVLMKDSIPVSRSLAAKYGNTGAKLIQQLHYWLNTESGEIVDGVRWIFKTISDWASELGVGTGTIKRVKKRLLEEGIIKVERLKSARWWQVNFYTIDYESLKTIFSDGSTCSLPLDQLDPITTNTTSKKKTYKTKPTHHPVKNGQREVDQIPQQTLVQTPNQIVQPAEEEIALREVREAGIHLNPTIQQHILSTIAQLGAAALQRIRKAAAVAAAAKDTRKDGRPTNREALFIQALKKGWSLGRGDLDRSSNVSEPLSASDPNRTPSPEKPKVPDGFNEWFNLARSSGLIVASEWKDGEIWVYPCEMSIT